MAFVETDSVSRRVPSRSKMTAAILGRCGCLFNFDLCSCNQIHQIQSNVTIIKNTHLVSLIYDWKDCNIYIPQAQAMFVLYCILLGCLCVFVLGRSQSKKKKGVEPPFFLTSPLVGE